VFGAIRSFVTAKNRNSFQGRYVPLRITAVKPRSKQPGTGFDIPKRLQSIGPVTIFAVSELEAGRAGTYTRRDRCAMKGGISVSTEASVVIREGVVRAEKLR
jgi:hypothetical protein